MASPRSASLEIRKRPAGSDDCITPPVWGFSFAPYRTDCRFTFNVFQGSYTEQPVEDGRGSTVFFGNLCRQTWDKSKDFN